MSMNVNRLDTIVVLMQCVWTQAEASLVCVLLDTQEMDTSVTVSIFLRVYLRLT